MKLTELEKELRDRYTRKWNSAKKAFPYAHTVALVVDGCSFPLSSLFATAKDADCVCDDLARALAKIVEVESR